MADKLGRINIVIHVDTPEGGYLTREEQKGIPYAQSVRNAIQLVLKKERRSPSS